MTRSTAAQIQADFERVDAQCVPYVARDRYEATCIAAGHTWEGQLTWIQGLALRIAGARCGWCGSMMVVEPVLMGSIWQRHSHDARACHRHEAAWRHGGVIYIDPIVCDECGCFQSKHDPECSQWQEPA